MLHRRIIYFLFPLIFFYCKKAASQQDDIRFLVNVIKDGYAGYSDKVKGEEFDLFVGNVIRKNSRDTFSILSSIANYFKDQHLKVYAYKNKINSIDSIRFSKNLQGIKNYLANLRINKDAYEGYWMNDYYNCVIALKKSSEKPIKYIGYIVESRNQAIPTGMECLKFKSIGNKEYLADFITPVSGFKVRFILKVKNDSVFTVGPFSKFKKLKDYNFPILSSLPSFDGKAGIRIIDSDNILIRIPSNSGENTRIVDSLINANTKVLNRTKNLIIDIRNNLGGTTKTYNSLLPFIYTNPIQRISVYGNYSKTYLKVKEDALREYISGERIDTALIRKKENQINIIKSNLGKSILSSGDLLILDTIKEYPKNVAVIVNYACYSAAEMMILDFKQSKKVQIFGETTFGAIDYLDMIAIDLPSKKYTVDVAISERAIPRDGQKLDGIGIKPDIIISDTEQDWVKFVVDYYAKKQ